MQKVKENTKNEYILCIDPADYADWRLPHFEIKQSYPFTRTLPNKVDEFRVRLISCKILVEPHEDELETRFHNLAEEWRKETSFMSSIHLKSMHEAYQSIIGMGMSAVPLILRELLRNPDHWFWALSAITMENPVQPEERGDLKSMTKAWLELGRKRGWI